MNCLPLAEITPLVRARCSAAEIAAFTGTDEATAQASIDAVRASGHAPSSVHRWTSRHPHGNGVSGSFEFALRFVLWAGSLTKPLSARAIQNHWGVHRSTAYRWLAEWRAAHGEVSHG